MPELSDGDDDIEEDEEQWQWMEEEDSQPVTCLFCDRWDGFLNTASSRQ